MTIAIVPAAGRGSRLGVPTPKALVKVAGSPMISRVLAALRPHIDQLVLVVQPEHEAAFERHLGEIGWDAPTRMIHQESPSGSADAVSLALTGVAPVDDCILVWADQVGVEERTIAAVAEGLGAGDVALVLPLAEVDDPYVWYEMQGDAIAVYRQRDGDTAPSRGDSDVGTFGFRAGAAQRALEEWSHRAGKERDFIYVVPAIAADGIRVVRVEDPNQTLAVNTPDDLARATTRLTAAR